MDEIAKNKSIKNAEIILISTCCFMLSYILIYILSGLTILYFAYDFDIKATLFFNQILIDTTTDSTKWTNDAITSIFIAQPICCLLIGFISLCCFHFTKKKSIIAFSLVIWLIIIGFTKGFSIIFNDYIFHSGLTLVADIMGFKSIANILILFFSMLFLLKLGQFIGKVFSIHIGSELFQTKSKRMLLLLNYFLIPCLLGSAIFLFCVDSHSFFKQLIFTVLGIIVLIPVFFTKPSKKSQPISFQYESICKTAIFLLCTIVFFVLIFFTLKGGIQFTPMQ